MNGTKPLTLVIKLGTSSIVNENTHETLLPVLSLIVVTVVKLRKDGHRVVIVSSGAVGLGLQRMGIDRRPKHLSRSQALAAIGQCRLISLWDQLFGYYGQPVAQILLTRNDIADHHNYLNAQNTISELLEQGVIPIINENDTLAGDGIKFGDNDTLAAITAAIIHSDLLFLMTDVDYLYNKNPRTNTDAQPIKLVEATDSPIADVSSMGSALGTGGMSTKVVAAKLATSAGVTTIITRSSSPDRIHRIVQYIQMRKSSFPETQLVNGARQTRDTTSQAKVSETSIIQELPPHTMFLPLLQPVRDRNFWLLHGLTPRGTLYIDGDAYCELVNSAGLLAMHILDVEGPFGSREAVRLVVMDCKSDQAEGVKSCEATQVEVGRALVNYAAPEVSRIKGCRTDQIEYVLGYMDSCYVADGSNISLF
ncbi:glutamate 5-kinase [Biscogniauxia mediterranea]|nr:glutamate 5-kinase [Biscogniauxia mediterranea]